MTANVRFPPIAVIRKAATKRPMRLSALVIGVVAGAVTSAAFWADGSTPGAWVASCITLGLGVFLSARTTDDGWLQAAIAITYLAMGTLASITASLIDQTIGLDSAQNLLRSSTILPAVILGLAVCNIFLRPKPGTTS